MSLNLDTVIRKIPNFPKPGILFYDITSILANPEAFSFVQDRFANLAQGQKLDAVAAIESRGFLFGAPLALRLGLPLVLVRKKGKLPGRTHQKHYALEYSEETIEVHVDDITPRKNILLIDDLVATGGSLKAACELLEELGSHVVSIFCVIKLRVLHPERILQDRNLISLIDYD